MSTKTLAPEAFITTRKNRLKIYDQNKIYLDTGTTFEIELFNPTNTRVLVRIWINDEPISASGLVIQPNSRQYLERYIDSAQKFKFTTFEVDNVQATKTARERNGLVRVQFYSEKESIFDYTKYIKYKEYTPNNGEYKPWPYGEPWIYPNASYGGNSSAPLYSANINASRLHINSLGTLSRNVSDISPEQIETGRIGKGENSKQEFTSTTGEFNTYITSKSEYQILPKSLKPVINMNEIRTYCTECGTRIKKSNWKYCPNCGKNL